MHCMFRLFLQPCHEFLHRLLRIVFRLLYGLEFLINIAAQEVAVLLIRLWKIPEKASILLCLHQRQRIQIHDAKYGKHHQHTGYGTPQTQAVFHKPNLAFQ